MGILLRSDSAVACRGVGSGKFSSFNLMPFTFIFHFPADIKKPDSFESGFLVFGVCALLRSDNAVECRSAHSAREPHSKCIESALGAYYFPFT